MKSILLRLAAALLPVAVAEAETLEVFPGDDLNAALTGLVAGDQLIIHEGAYSTQAAGGGFFLSVVWTGTPAEPILVRAADGARPVILGDPSQDVLRISGSYFTLRGLELTGGSQGLKLDQVDHATFEDLTIRDVGDVGISCNRQDGLCDRLIIRRNEIYGTGGDGGTGEAMNFGCNAAACEMVNSLITGNYLHDLGGNQAEGIDLKTGSWGNQIRDNVIVRAGLTGIAVGGYADLPGRTRNVIERNFIWDTTGSGIQVVGQALVSSNLVVASGDSGIRSTPNQGFDPRDLELVHNTVFEAGDACLRGTNWDRVDLGVTIVANNALYCASSDASRFTGGSGTATMVGNVGLGAGLLAGISPGTGAAEDFVDAPRLNYWPTATSTLLAAGSAAYARADFNGVLRSAPGIDAGAYERTAAGNPGWLPRAGFKTLPVAIFDDGFESGSIIGSRTKCQVQQTAFPGCTASILGI